MHKDSFLIEAKVFHLVAPLDATERDIPQRGRKDCYQIQGPKCLIQVISDAFESKIVSSLLSTSFA